MLHRDGSSCHCLVTRDIYEALILVWVQAAGYVCQDVVMAPGVLALVQGHLAVVQDMAGGLPALAQLAEVTGALAPLHKVVASWKSICDSIEIEFHCTLFHVVDE